MDCAMTTPPTCASSMAAPQSSQRRRYIRRLAYRARRSTRGTDQSGVIATSPTYARGYFPTLPTNVVQGNPGPGPVWMDLNAGRPARQYRWSVGFQREIFQSLAVDLTYVANRGVWWQAPVLINWNANTPERLTSFGLDVNNAADRGLLLSRMIRPL